MATYQSNGSAPWPDLSQLTLETLTTGLTDEREAYVSLLNRSTVTAIAKQQIQ